MCWCIKLSFTILSNLLSRLYNDFVDFLYKICSKLRQEDQYECSSLETDGGVICENVKNNQLQNDILSPSMSSSSLSTVTIEIRVKSSNSRKIELESYFKAVNRDTSEHILFNRVDGSCLVRPYKEKGACIKYITSIYAKNNYFHLYIRENCNGKFSLGLEKPKEKLFNSPIDIINYYSIHKLRCTNKFITICIFLIPIK